MLAFAIQDGSSTETPLTFGSQMHGEDFLKYAQVINTKI